MLLLEDFIRYYVYHIAIFICFYAEEEYGDYSAQDCWYQEWLYNSSLKIENYSIELELGEIRKALLFSMLEKVEVKNYSWNKITNNSKKLFFW